MSAAPKFWCAMCAEMTDHHSNQCQRLRPVVQHREPESWKTMRMHWNPVPFFCGVTQAAQPASDLEDAFRRCAAVRFKQLAPERNYEGREGKVR